MGPLWPGPFLQSGPPPDIRSALDRNEKFRSSCHKVAFAFLATIWFAALAQLVEHVIRKKRV